MIIDINNRQKRVKDVIVEILGKEWPLTARKIFNKIKNNCGLSVTYQAVHKALIEMVEENILTREGRDYSISIEWVKNNKQFYERLETKRQGTGRPSPEDIFNKDVTTLEFDNLHTFYSDMLEFFEYLNRTPKYYSNELTGPVTAQLYHMYWILSATREQDDALRSIMENSPNSYFICNGDTKADRMLSKYFESLGAKVKTGVKCAYMCDVFAGAGFVIQIFFTPEFKKELDGIYDNFGEMSESDITKLYDTLYRKKTEIQVIIIRNEELEKQIYQDTKRLYGVNT